MILTDNSKYDNTLVQKSPTINMRKKRNCFLHKKTLYWNTVSTADKTCIVHKIHKVLEANIPMKYAIDEMTDESLGSKIAFLSLCLQHN